MLEGLRRLIELQRIDAELAKLDAELAGLPQRRAELRAMAEAAEASFADARAALAAAERERRSLEAEVADKEEELKRLHGQSTQVKTNEAYTALLREIEYARVAVSERETRILELMDEIDAAGSRLAKVEAEGSAVRARVEAEETAIETRAQALEKELTRARGERAQLEGLLDRALIVRYERIAKARTPAIAIAADELCLGCRVRIPPQTYNDAIRGESIVECGSCHRILVYEALLVGATPREG